MKKIIAYLVFLVLTITTNAQIIVWRQLASLPEGYRNGGAVALNNKIYFVTGYDVNGNYSNRDFYRFDPEMNVWTKMANLPGCKVNCAVAEVNGKVYAIGGDVCLRSNYGYTPETNTWNSFSIMPTGRQHTGCGVYENKIYVMGGLDTWIYNGATITKKNEVFDIATNSWSEKAEIPTLRNYPAIVTLDSLIYVIGGGGSDTSIWTYIATVECYNSKTDTWLQKTNLPYVLFGPAAVVVNNEIIVLGGGTIVNDKEIFTNKILLYDAETDDWNEIATLPDSIGAFGCTSIGNKIYVIGGMKYINDSVYNILTTVYEGEYISSNIPEYLQKKILIFPNPSENTISIKNIDVKCNDLIYKVLNSNGQIVQGGKLTCPTLCISSLLSGLYVLVIEKNNGQIFKEKFVVE